MEGWVEDRICSDHDLTRCFVDCERATAAEAVAQLVAVVIGGRYGPADAITLLGVLDHFKGDGGHVEHRGSLTSPTLMVPVAVAEAFEGSEAVTTTVWVARRSWSRAAPLATRICPVALSMVKLLSPDKR